MGILALLLVLLMIPLTFVLIVYNNLINDRNMADKAFSSIDVMLKRRWDLIPNLVAAVKGYLQHESEVLQRVTRLRSGAIEAKSDAQRLPLESELTGALLQLRGVVERYPELKASENMLYLQRSLAECEEQISAARRAYNAAILQYNNRIQIFPNNLVAGWFGFRPREFFQIPNPEREVPRISRFD